MEEKKRKTGKLRKKKEIALEIRVVLSEGPSEEQEKIEESFYVKNPKTI